ncbi:YadA C-terminal domain-containing protein [Vibrio splendidus]|uniref:YadA C-terminal domain-containing protein n=1 Tax=Vibrio splendidus TaxID=29497 RepID=UPI001F53D2F3|nr:YadA C-terminal domain-containing protein [Vibrio splendidus]
MKKTIIALAVTSIFSGAAMAQTMNVSDIQNHFDSNGWKQKQLADGSFQIEDANGNHIGHASSTDGSYVFENTKSGQKIRINKSTGRGVVVDGGSISTITINDDTNYIPDNGLTPDNRDRINVSDIEKAIADNGSQVRISGDTAYIIDGTTVTGRGKLVDGKYEITYKGETVTVDAETGEATINGKSVVIVDDKHVPNVNPTPVKPVDPIKPVKPDNRWSNIEKIAKDNQIELEHENSSRYRVNAGEYTGYTINSKNGSVEDQTGKEIGTIHVDKSGNVSIKPKDNNNNNNNNSSNLTPADDRSNWKPNNDIISGDTKNDVTVDEIAEATKDWSVRETEDGIDIRNGDDEYQGTARYGDGKVTVSNQKTGEVLEIDGDGNYIHYDKNNVKTEGKIDDENHAINGGNVPNVNPDEPLEPIKPIHDEAGAISKEVDKRIDAAGAAAYNEASAYATATDAKLANHESRIGSLEKDMQAMGNKILVLEDRMDGVVASSHAITNARPVLNSAGQFGMGVGMGAAGSKQAIALGGAYQITDNWSGTMSVNYETKGKVSNDQLSAGVGAQYIF